MHARTTIFLLGLLLAPAAWGQTWGAYRYAHERVNIRQERSTASTVAGQLDAGDRVLVDFCSGGWCGTRRSRYGT